jgi:uncharacterized protein (DUF1330 family)
VPTVIAFHDVDDVDHWLKSPKRAAFFETHGITVRTFVDPGGSKRTGVILEVPDLAKLEEAMASEAASDAMQHDGVHADSVVMLVEA